MQAMLDVLLNKVGALMGYDLDKLLTEVGDAYEITTDGNSAMLIKSNETVALLLVEVYGLLLELTDAKA